MSGSSYRTMLRSSSIIGGAQIVNILASVAKMKVAALLLGPAGVGLVGIYINLMQTGASIASLGIGNVGTREIAAAKANGSDADLARKRRALSLGTVVLAVLGGVLFWLSSHWIARVFLASEAQADDVAWLSIGVAASVVVGSQAALLTGLHRVADLARITIGASVIGALLGVLALWLWRTQGLLVFILVVPAMTFLIGRFYIARLGRASGVRPRLSEMPQEWRAMLPAGVAFMVSGLIALLGPLIVRTLVQRELGPVALGQFQAAWTIGMLYLGFVLGAMGTDFYPRLTAVVNDRVLAARLINEQTEVALLLCAPVVLGMLGFAPWVIRVLYSVEFGPAVEVLRWQLLGDILKVITWPLGFLLLAAGAAKTFLLTETFAMAVLVLGTLIGLPMIGLPATGVAFLALYAAYLPLLWWLSRRRIGFRWTRAVWMQAAAVIVTAVAVDLAGRWSAPLGMAVGGLLAAVMGFWALMRLSAVAGAEGRLGRIAAFGERIRARITPKT